MEHRQAIMPSEIIIFFFAFWFSCNSVCVVHREIVSYHPVLLHVVCLFSQRLGHMDPNGEWAEQQDESMSTLKLVNDITNSIWVSFHQSRRECKLGFGQC